MKKYAVAIAFISVLGSANAMAYGRYNPTWNVGLSLGQTTASLVNGNQDFNYPTLGFSCGYQFTPVVGLLGEVSVAVNDVKDNFASDKLDADVSNEFSAVGVYLTAQTQGDCFVRGRIGLAESRFIYNAPGYADEIGSDFGVAYGFGAGLNYESMVFGLDYLQLPEVNDPLFSDDSYNLSSLTFSASLLF